MELYQLRTFVAVAKEGNLSRAAKLLATSQPALSAQIKTLEDELGIALFERSAKGMILTGEGQHLLEEAQRTLSSAGDLLEEARRLRGQPEGTVRIGAPPDPTTLRIGELLSQAAQRFPSVQIHLHHASSVAIRRDVLSGDLDCGFVLGPSEEKLDRAILSPVRLVVAVPSRCAIHNNSGWDALCELPWIATPDGCPFQVLGRDLFRKLGRVPRTSCQVDIESALVEAVSSGLGASLLHERTASLAESQGRCRIWPGASVATEYAFVWLKSRAQEGAISAMAGLVRAMWSS
jgi:DNA-binding transcriptional LysR family regulator